MKNELEFQNYFVPLQPICLGYYLPFQAGLAHYSWRVRNR